MNITLEISMYPLDADYKPAIKSFIHMLRSHTQLEVLSNQMSTQVRGEFDDVMAAYNECMKASMSDNERVVFVSKCLNAGLDISRPPDIE